jgi:hypothetical protein
MVVDISISSGRVLLGAMWYGSVGWTAPTYSVMTSPCSCAMESRGHLPFSRK